MKPWQYLYISITGPYYQGKYHVCIVDKATVYPFVQSLRKLEIESFIKILSQGGNENLKLKLGT
jgi:hypothetical protein